MSLSTQYPIETLETTGCIRRIKKVTRSHMFTIVGYSLDKDICKGEFLESTNFDVGGYDWSIKYYPNGSTSAKDDHISIFLFLKCKSECVKAEFSFTILDQSGCALPLSETTVLRSFRTDSNWGHPSFSTRAALESNIKDDCFVIQTVVTVFKAFRVEPTEVFALARTAQIVVPPRNIFQQFCHILESKNGADVTFEVDGQTFSAHKCILAARSPVFLAQFFGPMKEKSDTVIKIDEMEAPVFKALLHVIYTDSLPEFEEIEQSDEKLDAKLMAQHLLVAADRYSLERLKIICEKILCGSIDTTNVLTLLSLAERHSCHHLKEACLKFIASPGILQGLAATEQFQLLVGCRPLILKEPSVRRQYSLLLPVAVLLFVAFMWLNLQFFKG